MNYNLRQNRLFILFLCCWFVINLLQAVYTEIYPDESYYLLYGKYLSWGYFDHPPMVALVARASSLLFSGNLGIRFVTVVLQIATLILVWLQLDNNHQAKKKAIFFFIIAASMVMFSAYGFITAPDGPLLFFTALFLYAYKQFCSKKNMLFTFMMAVAMAGLVYSKYHGLLVIGFVLLSNIRLLANPKFYLAAIGALLLVMPHLWWQYINSFPSFSYHLLDRSEGFKWEYLMEYPLNQLLVFNPFTLGAIFYVIYKYNPAQLFDKALYSIIIGFLSFFWIMALRGHVEPHWTNAASIPMIILLTNKIWDDGQLLLYVRKFLATSLLLVLVIRILITTDKLPASFSLSGKKNEYISIEKIAGNRPVIFTGSFQNPSLYTFFTGNRSTVISSLDSRQTQFDLWQFEQKWINKEVFVCGTFEGKSTPYTINENVINGFFTDSFQTANKLRINFSISKQPIRKGDSLTINFTIQNPTLQAINFNHAVFPIEICPVFVQGKILKKAAGTLSQNIILLKANEQLNNQIKFSIPNLPNGVYLFGLSCNTLFGPAINSNFEKITLL